MTRAVRWMMMAGVVAGLSFPLAVRAQTRPEGISVHGHWVIEVRNPDGSLHERREFENALVETGQRFLVAYLGKAEPLTDWVIGVYPSGGAGPCDTVLHGCFLREPTVSTPAGSHDFKTLTVTPDGVTLTLQGSFVAGLNTNVSRVLTFPNPWNTAFTGTTLASPIAVQATQTVSVTVTFTFS